MEWSRIARQEVARVALTIPDDTPLKARKALIDAAYPWGPRDYWPWKAWCKARRAYLERHGLKPLHPPPRTLLDDLPRDPVTGRPVIQ
jgi:hypothetical protein